MFPLLFWPHSEASSGSAVAHRSAIVDGIAESPPSQEQWPCSPSFVLLRLSPLSPSLPCESY